MESSSGKKWTRFKRFGMLLALIAVFVVMLRAFEHNQVYHPQRHLDASGADLGRPWEDVRFSSRDGVQLHGWYFPNGSQNSHSNFVVLLCHGNGGNISHRLDLYEALLQTGVGVFTFDYRGYGKSAGRPSEHGTYADATAALEWLRRRGINPHQVLLLGESLGGGVASELASREPVAGLILLSSFTSIPDVGAEFFPWLPVRLLSSIRYDTHSRLKKIRMPLMVMHSRNDGLIGFQHGRANFEAAHEPKLFWELTGTHNDPLHRPEHFVEGIRAFLKKVESNREATPASAPR